MTFGKEHKAVIADDHGVIRGALAQLLGNVDALEGYRFTIADQYESTNPTC